MLRLWSCGPASGPTARRAAARPAAAPACSGATTAWVATVVNAYTSPMVNPPNVSAARYGTQLSEIASAASEVAEMAVPAPITVMGARRSASRPDSAPPIAAPIDGLVVAGTVSNVAYGVTIYLSTLNLQQVRSLDPLTAGLAFLGQR